MTNLNQLFRRKSELLAAKAAAIQTAIATEDQARREELARIEVEIADALAQPTPGHNYDDTMFHARHGDRG
jgi:hypothetical protein